MENENDGEKRSTKNIKGLWRDAVRALKTPSTGNESHSVSCREIENRIKSRREKRRWPFNRIFVDFVKKICFSRKLFPVDVSDKKKVKDRLASFVKIQLVLICLFVYRSDRKQNKRKRVANNFIVVSLVRPATFDC